MEIKAPQGVDGHDQQGVVGDLDVPGKDLQAQGHCSQDHPDQDVVRAL